jgi:cytochrome c peroxidase
MMKIGHRLPAAVAAALLTLSTAQAQEVANLEAGSKVLREWLLPKPPHPEGNEPTPERVALGKRLFFDPRLSGDGEMSCATCHNPALGWSDGLPTAKGHKGAILARATPTIVNSAYNDIFMWDGRKRTLEEQALGPMEAQAEMNTDLPKLYQWLNADGEYRTLFQKAYPGKGINAETLAMAIAAYERTVVSNNSPFDRWVKGEKGALTKQQVRGFKLFVGKANCVVCHSAPNFTDNGFHNLGLSSFSVAEPDLGRFGQKPIASMRGAFKTPTLRDVERTAPYFHDGSARSLLEVVEHYDKGGVVKNSLSPNMKPLNLSRQEKEDLVAFMRALTTPAVELEMARRPRGEDLARE